MVGRSSDGEAATAATSGTHTNISDHMNNVVTIIFQNKADNLFRDQLDLSSINYKKNVGHVLEAVLNTIGIKWSASGKCIWWAAEPGGEKLSWRAPAKQGSRAPAEQRSTAMDGVAAMDLEHDASAPAAGSRASHAAAAAARPTQPRALPLVSPEAHDRVSCGTGWGHVPRPITECCVAEQGSIDDLVLREMQ